MFEHHFSIKISLHERVNGWKCCHGNGNETQNGDYELPVGLT